MELSIQHLSKKYSKEKYGLKDLSLTIENGILGLLGPNGAMLKTIRLNFTNLFYPFY